MLQKLICPLAFWAFFVCLFQSKNGAAQSPLTPERDSFKTVVQHVRDSLPPYHDLSDDQLKELAGRFISQAELLEGQLLQELNYAEYAQEQARFVLKKKEKDPAATPADLQEATVRLQQAESRTRKSKALREKAEKTSTLATKTSKKNAATMRYDLQKVEASIISLLHQTEQFYDLPQRPLSLPDEEKGIVPTSPTSPQSEPVEAEKMPETTKIRRNWDDFEQYDPRKDPMLVPPAPPCEIAFEGKDEFSGESRTELRRELLWTFTNDFMRNFLKEKPHILGEAHLSATSGGLRFLNLTVTINDNNAKKGFGGLARGAQLTLKFIDGSTVLLRNARADDGVADDDLGFTVFSGIFPIEDRGILAQIKKKELDRVRLAWANGFEDYEIFNVDLLMRQAECLFK